MLYCIKSQTLINDLHYYGIHTNIIMTLCDCPALNRDIARITYSYKQTFSFKCIHLILINL